VIWTTWGVTFVLRTSLQASNIYLVRSVVAVSRVDRTLRGEGGGGEEGGGGQKRGKIHCTKITAYTHCCWWQEWWWVGATHSSVKLPLPDAAPALTDAWPTMLAGNV
jgi:hypothetical protein